MLNLALLFLNREAVKNNQQSVSFHVHVEEFGCVRGDSRWKIKQVSELNHLNERSSGRRHSCLETGHYWTLQETSSFERTIRTLSLQQR